MQDLFNPDPPREPATPQVIPPPVTPSPPGTRPSNHRQLSPTLSRICQRALTTTPDQVRLYQPTEFAVACAEAMLAGEMTFKGIAEHLTGAYETAISARAVGELFRDPVVCAWISEQINGAISSRLGMIDAAMLNRALTGNVNAAKLLYERYGKLQKRAISLNVDLPFDPSQLSAEQLRKLADQSERNLGGATEDV